MKHSNVFYIHKFEGRDESGNMRFRWEAVQNARAHKNEYGLDLFKTEDNISEGKSGLKLCNKDKLDETIQKYGVEKINQIIQQHIEKYGLSPRYTRPDETKKDVFQNEEQTEEDKEIVKLMKPLFIDGMFNKEGKRIRAKYIKTLTFGGEEYPLWIGAGKNEKDYPRDSNDTHYMMIQAGDYLVPCGNTEYDLEQRGGYAYLNREWYGDYEGRNKFFDELRNGKTYEESEKLIKEQIAKEEVFIAEYGKEDIAQITYLITSFINPCIIKYIEARDNNGTYASFHGAAFLNELDKCVEISNRLKAIRKQEDDIKRAEREEQKRKEAEEKQRQEQELIKATEKTFISGGTIKNGEIIVKLADKYGVNIPIRTRGWILNTLSECTISDSGGVSYRYWKKKNGTGSQKVYDILFEIRKAIQTAQAA